VCAQPVSEDTAIEAAMEAGAAPRLPPSDMTHAAPSPAEKCPSRLSERLPIPRLGGLGGVCRNGLLREGGRSSPPLGPTNCGEVWPDQVGSHFPVGKAPIGIEFVEFKHVCFSCPSLHSGVPVIQSSFWSTRALVNKGVAEGLGDILPSGLSPRSSLDPRTGPGPKAPPPSRVAPSGPWAG